MPYSIQRKSHPRQGGLCIGRDLITDSTSWRVMSAFSFCSVVVSMEGS